MITTERPAKRTRRIGPFRHESSSIQQDDQLLLEGHTICISKLGCSKPAVEAGDRQVSDNGKSWGLGDGDSLRHGVEHLAAVAVLWIWILMGRLSAGGGPFRCLADIEKRWARVYGGLVEPSGLYRQETCRQ